jgi:hypothetical protein
VLPDGSIVLIGVKDLRYLDATATHRNRGPEDIARYTRGCRRSAAASAPAT